MSCFTLRETIALSGDATPSRVHRFAEIATQATLRDADVVQAPSSITFWTPLNARGILSLVHVSIAWLTPVTGHTELVCSADYGVWGWSGFVAFLLVFGPIVIMTDSLGTWSKVAVCLVYWTLPTLYFRINFAGFARALRQAELSSESRQMPRAGNC